MLTINVGKRLNRDGEIWLIFMTSDKVLSLTLNKLLLIGYYLVNIGYIFYSIISWPELYSYMKVINTLASKISIILLILCYLHYQNIIIISIIFKFKHQKKWKI